MTLNNAIRGHVRIALFDRAGNCVRRHEGSNLVVSDGKSLMADVFRGEEAAPISHVALGSGGSEVMPADLDLEDELSPRKTFQTNTFSPESGASLVLQNSRGNEVVKLIAKEAGVQGNDIMVKISSSGRKAVDIMIYDINVGDASNEEYRGVNMRRSSPDFLVNRINEQSQLVTAQFLGRGMPQELDWNELKGGKDAEITLAVNFGFEECNGALCEAGLFNAEEEGRMYSRIVFPEINKTEDLSLALVWKISL